MNRSILSLTLCLSLANMAQAQAPAGARGGMAAQMSYAGHLYGKVVDTKTQRPIDGATVQLLGSRMDTARKQMREVSLATQIAASNGDFSLDNLPVMGKMTLKITAIGYKELRMPVSFEMKRPAGGAPGEDRMAAMANMVDKDLGNLALEAVASTLDNVTVTATTRQLFEMGVDRKIFNVDKNLVSTGQTATEIMRNIPSVSVDIDGNVTVRNAAPTLFVDGRPTTLTLDQIPADIIDKVELITNPSAKFDASGGNAGILNIVLKKNRRSGYNGGVRAGIDSRARVNLGGDLNYRQGKFNFTGSGQFAQRKSISWIDNDRNVFPTRNLPNGVQVLSDGLNVGRGYFSFVRGGLDYLVDNRNTISLAANYNKGQFNNEQDQVIDSLVRNGLVSYSANQNRSTSNFENFGGQLSFKHNFAKAGHSLSADANYNSANNNSVSNLGIYTYAPNTGIPKQSPFLQRNLSGGTNKFYTVQVDYENPITDTKKFEAGARAAIRDFGNNLDQFIQNPNTGEYVLVAAATSKYKYIDQVYAAYGTYSFRVNKWSYQLGLRVESSDYEGTLLGGASNGADTSFRVRFPLSLFPSAFITYKLSESQDLQFNYSRRVNRPNFFQLIPFPDLSDPQNINIGNVALKPEFTNSLEVNYNWAYKRGANLLISAFYKNTENLISRFQYLGQNPVTKDSVVYNTFANASRATNFGLELTNRMPVAKWYDLTANVNFFRSEIDGNNIQEGLSNSQFSWFAKLNNNFKLPKSFSVQLSGDYYARTVLPPNSGGGGGGRFGGGGGGGGPFGGGPQVTAQGFIFPRYAVDIAIRKDWSWKGGNSASLTLSMNDMLRTQLFKTYSESPFFNQTAQRRRDPQVLRLNFNYRFGKFDVQLFKRKNTKAEGADMGGVM